MFFEKNIMLIQISQLIQISTKSLEISANDNQGKLKKNKEK